MKSKLENPRYFKKVKTKPVEYVNSSQAWMTSALFERWLLNIYKKSKKQKWEIILFMNISTAHNYVPLMEMWRWIFPTEYDINHRAHRSGNNQEFLTFLQMCTIPVLLKSNLMLFSPWECVSKLGFSFTRNSKEMF